MPEEIELARQSTSHTYIRETSLLDQRGMNIRQKATPPHRFGECQVVRYCLHFLTFKFCWLLPTQCISCIILRGAQIVLAAFERKKKKTVFAWLSHFQKQLWHKWKLCPFPKGTVGKSDKRQRITAEDGEGTPNHNVLF